MVGPHLNSAWLHQVAQKLQSQGYTLASHPHFGQVAQRTRFELTKCGFSETFFVFKEFDALDTPSLRSFSKQAFEYALSAKKIPLPRGLFESVWCFAVAVVDQLDAHTLTALREEAPTKHWASAEIPVVYQSHPQSLAYFEKTPLWGAAYYAGFRAQIKACLA